MDDKIRRLRELQQIGLALRTLEIERQQGPIRLESLEQAYGETSATVGAAKHRHEALRQECAALETELKDLQVKLGKFQTQLMEVKNSREYSAVLKEIDTAKAEISKRDEDLLTRMQEMETLSKDVPEAEANLAVETKRFEAEKAAVQVEMAAFDKRREQLEAEKKRIEVGLPRDVIAAFYRIAEARQGVAMVGIREAICSACNVRLRPQAFSEVRRGETLVSCDSCRRFLYYDVEGGSPQPSGDAPAQS